MRQCTIEGCSHKHVAKGLCAVHRYQAKVYDNDAKTPSFDLKRYRSYFERIRNSMVQGESYES